MRYVTFCVVSLGILSLNIEETVNGCSSIKTGGYANGNY